MKNILRNFLSVLRHYKTASLLNILGLSAAFAAFLIIMLKVSYELGYDKFHPDSERIYKMELFSQEQANTFEILPRGTINEFIHSSPHIEAGAALMPAWGGNSYFTYVRNGDKVGILKKIFLVDPSFVSDVIGFTMVAGTPDCLKNSEQILIPESVANQFIGSDPIGKTITCNDNIWGSFNGPKDLIIGGVYKDFPSNSMMENEFYLTIPPTFQIDSFQAANFQCYVKLDNPEFSEQICEQFIQNFKEESWQKPSKATLTVLSDLYLNNPQNKSRVRLLGCIALLIILIAAINFTNFATSLAPVRIKSLNTMKVMGASTQSLRTSLIFEGICTTLVSFGIGLLVVFASEKSHLLAFFSKNLHLIYNLWPLLLTAGLAFLIGFISGIWPAIYMTSFSPALVLKGSFGLTPKGRRFRTILISIQYIVSFGLIIASFCMDRQNSYLLHQNLGFSSDNVAVVQLSNAHLERKDYFVNSLKGKSQVVDVAFAGAKIGGGDTFTTESFTYNGVEADFTYIIPISYNLLKLLEVPLLDGRWATESEEKNQSGAVILNSFAQKAMGIVPETPIDYYRGKLITGIVDDIHITSLRNPIRNTLYVVSDNLPIAYVKFSPGTSFKEGTEIITSVLKEIDPVYPQTIEFYDQLITDLYSTESNFGAVIRLFGLLAIAISIMGVFGMVVFETQYRKKEIGLRKIMGSTVREILVMYNVKYVILTIVCCIIASPIAYVLINRWLKGFAYHTGISWWIFILAFLVISFITFATVTWQSWRSATSNPVDSLKNE